MAINYQQIYDRVHEIGAKEGSRRKALEERRALARQLLAAFAGETEALRNKVERIASDHDPNLRCALPLDERLDAHAAQPSLPGQATLIAADGSQINPDRHAAIQFGLVNVGAIVMRTQSGLAPEVVTDSELLFDEALLTSSGAPLTEGLLALRRDLSERRALDELSRDLPAPVITFTDGPMELWGGRDPESARAFQENLEQYRTVLSRLQSRGVVTAGYVDKPFSELVVRLLEVAMLPENEIKQVGAFRPLRGVSDRWLFGNSQDPLLQPGERSAVFAIQSGSTRNYTGQLALHFFYLNVGTEKHPWPVRVELPRWVADDHESLDRLHAVLVEQCRIMGSKPYPYLLHRAHEAAVVSLDDRKQVEQMLSLELQRSGGELDEGSSKQFHKDQPGKTRYRA